MNQRYSIRRLLVVTTLVAIALPPIVHLLDAVEWAVNWRVVTEPQRKIANWYGANFDMPSSDEWIKANGLSQLLASTGFALTISVGFIVVGILIAAGWNWSALPKPEDTDDWDYG